MEKLKLDKFYQNELKKYKYETPIEIAIFLWFLTDVKLLILNLQHITG